MTAHATLGASSAKRWMNCPGSVKLSEGLPDSESDHAREGSAAHALGETCLLTGEMPFEYLGEPVPHADHADHTVSQDMVDAVMVYVRYVRSFGRKITAKMVERRVDLEPLGEWAAGMFGTADFVLFDGRRQVLHIVDYKHGQGVLVDTDDNPQLMYYAVGALLALGKHNVKDRQRVKVEATIVQPRVHHPDGPIRTIVYTADELLTWAETTLRDAVEATRHDHPPLIPSDDACRFCKARGICPALADQAMDQAMLDFDGDDVVPRKPLDRLSGDDVARILDNEKTIRNWLDGVASLAQRSLKQGQDVTNGHYKLVAGRKKRLWKNEDVAATRLYSLGFDDTDLYSHKLLTPAQAETLVGKKQREEIADLIAKEDGKPTLAPVDDQRPAIDAGPEADFQERRHG